MERRLFKLLMESYSPEADPDCEVKPKECVPTNEQQATELFLYLSGRFNTQQFDDFY